MLEGSGRTGHLAGQPALCRPRRSRMGTGRSAPILGQVPGGAPLVMPIGMQFVVHREGRLVIGGLPRQ